MDSNKKISVFKIHSYIDWSKGGRGSWTQNVVAASIDEAMAKFRNAVKNLHGVDKDDKPVDVVIHLASEHCEIDIV